jgi:hypothetical protein
MTTTAKHTAPRPCCRIDVVDVHGVTIATIWTAHEAGTIESGRLADAVAPGAWKHTVVRYRNPVTGRMVAAGGTYRG